jgi:hypothetical protein
MTSSGRSATEFRDYGGPGAARKERGLSAPSEKGLVGGMARDRGQYPTTACEWKQGQKGTIEKAGRQAGDSQARWRPFHSLQTRGCYSSTGTA